MEIVSKKVVIQGNQFMFRPNFRALMEYEELSGNSVDDVKTLKDYAMFIYSGVKAGEIYAKREFTIKFDEFLDMLDGMDILTILADDTPAPKPVKKTKTGK